MLVDSVALEFLKDQVLVYTKKMFSKLLRHSLCSVLFQFKFIRFHLSIFDRLNVYGLFERSGLSLKEKDFFKNIKSPSPLRFKEES